MKSIDLNEYAILTQDQNRGSNKYLHIPTIKAANVLIEHGWLPREVVAKNSRAEGRMGFQKHRVRFFNPDMPMIKDSMVEILLTNSYDARSSFQLQLGIFRMVCSNGMVVGETFKKESVRHLGYSDDKVFEAINLLLPNAESICDSIDRFSSIKLSENKIMEYGKQIIDMRLDDNKNWIADEDSVKSLFTYKRSDDNNQDLWTLMNRAQENMVRYGFQVKSKGETKKEYKKVRAIKNQLKGDRINTGLWNITEDVYKANC